MKPRSLASQIDPKLDPKFSPRMFRWLRRHPDECHVYRDKDGVRFIGKRGPGDSLVRGARLGGVLTGRATDGCWLGSVGWKEEKSFWQRYLKIGRCLLDPEHVWHEDEGRFEQKSPRVRVCRWCGARLRLRRWTRKITCSRWELSP